MPANGKVFWDPHPANRGAPEGHQNKEGAGELIGFSADEHGFPCGVIETDAGAFILIRMHVLRRTADKPAEALEDRQETSQAEEPQPQIRQAVAKQQRSQAEK